MNADEILTRTFADHESLAPDPEVALAGVRRRVHGRRRRTVTRTLTVVGASAAVAAVMLGSSLVRGDAPTARGTQAAAPPARPAPRPVTAPDFVTIAAGWLPVGKVQQVIVANYFDEQTVGYDVTAPDGSTTYILVKSAPGTALPTEYKRGTPHDTTIGGRPAREWSVDDWYYLAFTLPHGRVAIVDVAGGPNEGKGGDGSAAALAAVGRRVGAHLRTGVHASIEPGFTLTHLPPGLVVRGAGRDTSSGTSYTLAPRAARAADTMPDYPTVGEVKGDRRTALDLTNGKGGKRQLPVAPGRPVQGHPTYLVGGRPYPVLFIESVRPGVSIVISGGSGLTSLDEVYRIADGLRL